VHALISLLYTPQGNSVNPSAGSYKVIYTNFVLSVLTFVGKSTVKTLCFVHVLCLLQFGAPASNEIFSAMAEDVQSKLPHQCMAASFWPNV